MDRSRPQTQSRKDMAVSPCVPAGTWALPLAHGCHCHCPPRAFSPLLLLCISGPTFSSLGRCRQLTRPLSMPATRGAGEGAIWRFPASMMSAQLCLPLTLGRREGRSGAGQQSNDSQYGSYLAISQSWSSLPEFSNEHDYPSEGQ